MMTSASEELQRLLHRELYKKSFYAFVKDFWECADPSKFVDGKLIQFYCETFQYYCRQWIDYDEIAVKTPKKTKDNEIIDVRQNKKNLCLMVPPRHTKSMIFNVMGPVWLWISYPVKVASISHTSGLASQMNEKRAAIINHPKFKYYFNDIELTTNSKTFLRDSRGGELYSLNRNSFTGYGGDIIINDDLTNAETARKDKEEMNNAWSYYQNTMPSRINDPKKCIIMNIQQRLAPNDIAGHIMNDKALRSQYTFITLPAIFNKDTYLVCPISGEIIFYKKGASLWPERFDDYQSLKAQVGESIFETQYLQNPIATDKTVIKPDMIIEQGLDIAPSYENADMMYASYDFPVKDKEDSDFLGCCLAYRIGSSLYITDCREKHMAFPESVKYVEQHSNLYPGIIQVIEDKANGSPILQQLQNVVPGMHAYQPGTNSKTQRLESASLYMTSGNVILVKTKYNKFTNEWELSDDMQNLKTRLLNFPFVEHDDIVDAFSMLILFVFMDKKYSVYGRSFNDANIINMSDISHIDYSTIFFNKEGDNWKVVEIAVKYGLNTTLYVTREEVFKANVEDGLKLLKKFAPNKSVFIDCSEENGLIGMYTKGVGIERYEIDDFERSVSQLNLVFSRKLVMLDKSCHYTKADIESFKFNKTKDETVKYVTEKDGFVACLRIALKYYGI